MHYKSYNFQLIHAQPSLLFSIVKASTHHTMNKKFAKLLQVINNLAWEVVNPQVNNKNKWL